ncbi:FtsX-like permease family protein [Streptomyces sp. ACA25]|uniref:ABC transporter permease n=1 Tax=Streptomyces sp. ACA25 TaxID=3022596 RepID=UPI002306F80B|nr:FtsX-like permease family protein [Streptomyces sp. ACA25]MDB1087225.1 FtsX-like permease family protein [Streptomyces sp. ACA25]
MTVVKTSLRNFYAHKGRMILSGTAVLLSVAFVCGTLVFTATMQTTFDKLFAETASDVIIAPEDTEGGSFDSASMTGRPATLPASVVDEVRQVDGVEEATGVAMSESVVVVDSDNESIGPTTGAPTIALNWTDIELRSMELTEGSLPDGPGEVLLDSQSADNADLSVGDELRLISVTGDHPATISGIVEFQITNPGATLVYFDTPTAQEVLLGDTDAFTEVYVDGTGAVSEEQLKERITALLGEDTFFIRTSEEYVADNQDALGEVFSIIQYVLLGFAGIALLVGIFLIVNTFTMLVAQRTREIGLMRAIGASRKQINRSVLVEALLLGVVGSLLGFAVGLGIAVGLMTLMSALGMNLSTDDLTIGWSVPVIGIILGVTVTLIAAYIPARRAGRITPMAALRDAGTPGDAKAGRTRSLVGALLTVAGLATLAGTAGVDEAATGSLLLAVGIPLSLIGMVLVGPALVGWVVSALSAVLLRGFGSVGRLAERNALRNPRRTGATASALMIGLALVSGLSVVGSSMVASASKQIDESIGADYVIQTSNWMPILPAATEAIRSADNLRHVTEYRGMDSELTAPNGETFSRNLGAVNPTYTEDVASTVEEGDLEQALAPGGLALDAGTVETYGLSVGDELAVDLDGEANPVLELRAVLSLADSMDGDAALMGMATLEEHVSAEAMPLPLVLFVMAEEGQQDAARASLEEALAGHPQMEVRDQADYKEMVENEVGVMLNMVYGLLALAIIVAILGVVNTLALSVIERTREIGLMRAIGLSRRQLRRMIRLESVVIALFGALLGIALGLAWGAAAQQILALEGFRVLEIPWATIVTVFIGAALVGLLAALIPAFRAGRMNILKAIATE